MLKQIFTLSSGSKKLVAVMSVVAIIAVSIAYYYYGSINKLEDPRIIHIKKIHLNYNKAVNDNNSELALSLLDSMDREFSRISHYKNSFERGVVSTDKGAIYLNEALYVTKNEEARSELLETAEKNFNSSLLFYSKWEKEYSDLSDHELIDKVSSEFSDIDSEYIQGIIENRVSEIKLALHELDRRYSVTYTDLGIVMRHKLMQDSAVVLYKKALELWDKNHVAKSNLNVLLGGEPIKQGVIDKLFPPERK